MMQADFSLMRMFQASQDTGVRAGPRYADSFGSRAPNAGLALPSRLSPAMAGAQDRPRRGQNGGRPTEHIFPLVFASAQDAAQDDRWRPPEFQERDTRPAW